VQYSAHEGDCRAVEELGGGRRFFSMKAMRIAETAIHAENKNNAQIHLTPFQQF